MSKTTTGASLLLLICCGLMLSMPSCVSKKKFLAQSTRLELCDSTSQILNRRIMSLNGEIASLQLKLAEKTGEANGLLKIYDKQKREIDQLESEIEKLTRQSLTQQQVLDGALSLKEKELTNKKALIDRLKQTVENQEQSLRELVGKVAGRLNQYNSEDISVEIKDGLGYITLSEKLLFRPRSLRLSNKAYDVLQSIATVLRQYPKMDILVLGHTDNQPVSIKGPKNNRELSVLRATPVVQLLVKEFGLNPNQVIAGGKGDSKPKTSNDTPQGRAQNRRVEIVVMPPVEEIVQFIRQMEN